MTRDLLRQMLLRCTIVNYALPCAWFLLFCLAHDRILRFHGR